MATLKTTIQKITTNRGFTLIELIVSVGIFVFLTLIVLVNHSRFSGAILLENLAYDIAISIRQAQVFGLSVREFEAGTGEFQPGYGIYFDNSPTTYVLFADRNLNFRYDSIIPCGVMGSECIEEFAIQQGNSISRFCGTLPSGVVECSPALSFITVVFVRPDPDALITSSNLGNVYSDATITIRSPQGVERDIIMRVTGQISIPQ